MADSTYLTDGQDSTNIPIEGGGVTDENAVFKTPNAAVKDIFPNIAPMNIESNEFVEIEFSIMPTITSGTYCFRVTNAGSTDGFTYTRYPEATVIPYYLTFSLDSNNINFGDLMPGDPKFATNTLAVEVNNPTGFQIKVKRDNATATMIKEDKFIPDATAGTRMMVVIPHLRLGLI